jgi:LPS sulfotransferase NodH
MRKFAVFHYGRSGSTSLCRFFAAIGIDIVTDEIFHPGLGIHGERSPDFDMAAAMDEVYAKHGAVKHNHPTATQSENNAFIAYHRERDYRILYLRRTDHLMMAISEAVARGSGMWHAYGDGEKEKHASCAEGISLDLDKVRQYMEYSREMDERYAPILSNGFAMLLSYEGIFNRPIPEITGSIRHILDFIDWEGPDVAVHVEDHLAPKHKMITPSILDRISNIEAIEREFGVHLRRNGPQRHPTNESNATS